MARAKTAPSSGSRCWSAAAGSPVPSPAASSNRARGRSRPGSERGALTGQTRAHEGDGFIGGEFGAAAVAAVAILEPPGLETTGRDHQAMWNAEQLRVGGLDPRPRIAVVVEHLDTGGAELGGPAVAR